MKNVDIIELANLSDLEIRKTYEVERKKIKQEDAKNILYVHVFAGHGVLFDGEQCLLVNEYDKRTKFYVKFKAETKIREMAEYDNTYHITLFACCRELGKRSYEYLCQSEVNKIYDA